MRVIASFLFSLTLLIPSVSRAGSVDPPAAPTDATSAMFTVDDLYNRLFNGATGTKRLGAFAEPGALPAPTGHTFNEIMTLAPYQDDANGAAPADVVNEKKYWDLRTGYWGLGTGNLGSRAITSGTTSFVAGYFPETDLTTVDTDLVATNILHGVSIFGVTGNANVWDTTLVNAAAAGDIVTGKKGWANGVQVSGSLASGSNISSGALTTSIPTGVYSGRTYTVADANLLTTNIRSGVSIFGVTGSVVGAAGTAVAANVYTGKTFSTGAGAATGTMPNNAPATYTPGVGNISIPAGYHGGTDVVSGDANLVSGNIRGGDAGGAGVSIFSISGSVTVADTSSGTATTSDVRQGKKVWSQGAEITGTYNPGTAPARVAKTGQTTSYAAGDDGHLRIGAGKVYPRFTDNGDGTVRDNLTGLIWLKDAHCFGARTWAQALNDANTLGVGVGTCGGALSDGSTPGQWRLPSDQELASLGDYAFESPAVPNTAGSGKWTEGAPFMNVQSNHYWSSTAYAGTTSYAWNVYLGGCDVSTSNKTNTYYVWPVRDGQLQAGPAPAPRTGQTGCWNAAGGSIACANTGQDGELRKGVAWPNPRFTKNGDNTMTDNLTGLMWREDASAGPDCGLNHGMVNWATAMASVQACNAAAYAGYADWRLPTVNELRSLTSKQYINPAVPNTAGTGQWSAGDPFMNVQSSAYWSSTAYAGGTTHARTVYLDVGIVNYDAKSVTYYVWPVRGGQ